MRWWVILGVLWSGWTGSAFAADEFSVSARKWYQSYKQSLFQTSNQDKEKAREALDKASQWWGELVDQYWENPPAAYRKDRRFLRLMAEIDGRLRIAARQVEDGKADTAHETLEGIRQGLRETRVRNRVDTREDRVTRFHEVMEKITLTARQSLTPAAMQSIRSSLPALNKSWSEVMNYPRPDLTAEERSAMERVHMAILGLAKAVQNRDTKGTAESARTMRQSFVAFFVPYG